MMALDRTRITEPDLADLLEGIHEGRLALPNFQRDFDWSDTDIKSLLGTVLSGWPMGSLLLIEGSGATYDFYQPRRFERAPELPGAARTIVLDGQQRLTALYSAFFDRGSTVFAADVRSVGEDWNEIDALDESLRSFRRADWERNYPDPAAQWAAGLVPVSALRTAADFFEWRDQAGGDAQLTDTYRKSLAGLHKYRLPAVLVGDDLPPAAVARIFERVNKSGRRLGTFDLMVAKSFTSSFNLRTRWAAVAESHPEVYRFFGEDGLAPLQVISLRSSAQDVRQSAVLGLTGSAIRDGWPAAVDALRKAVEELSILGVTNSDLLPYGVAAIVLAASSYDRDLASDRERVTDWFWATCLGGRYAVGSNTVAVADFRRFEGSKPVVESVSIDFAEFRDATKQANGALHRAFLCAMSSSLALPNGANPTFYSLIQRGAAQGDPPPHLKTLGFVTDFWDAPAETVAPQLFLPEATDFLLRGEVTHSEAADLFEYRLRALVNFISARVSVPVTVKELDSPQR
ncbi:MAG: GmrSD restriction endonuclease domain-containing protein [Nocardioides sp.]